MGLLAPFPIESGAQFLRNKLCSSGFSHSATREAGKVSAVTAGIILSYSARGKLLPNGTLSPPFNYP